MLGDHESIQVGLNLKNGSAQVGILGILNGFCGVIEEGDKKGYGPITAVCGRENKTILKFVRTEEA